MCLMVSRTINVTETSLYICLEVILLRVVLFLTTFKLIFSHLYLKSRRVSLDTFLSSTIL